MKMAALFLGCAAFLVVFGSLGAWFIMKPARDRIHSDVMFGFMILFCAVAITGSLLLAAPSLGPREDAFNESRAGFACVKGRLYARTMAGGEDRYMPVMVNHSPLQCRDLDDAEHGLHGIDRFGRD